MTGEQRQEFIAVLAYNKMNDLLNGGVILDNKAMKQIRHNAKQACDLIVDLLDTVNLEITYKL